MSAIEQCDYYGDEVSTLGERISVARERAGLSQDDLAKALAIKSDVLENWENDAAEPRAQRMTILGGILGVSAGWLLYGIGEGVPAPDGEVSTEEFSDERLAQMLMVELRDAQEMQSKITKRMSRIEEALGALKVA
jgi:transcriptional regulator with XRE-family HTH domain